MGELIALSISAYIVAFSGAVMPGPLLTATVHESAGRGFSAGPLFIIGHGILELLLLLVLLLGAAPILTNTIFFTCVSIVGGVIMGIMAFTMFLGIPKVVMPSASGSRMQGKLVFKGALLSLANPYWTIWWATIGLSFLAASRGYGFTGIVIFFTGHILGDLTWYGFISYIVSKGRRFLTDRRYKLLIAVCAGVLFVFAVLFIVRGLGKALETGLLG
ncbi:MAG: LysE family transporter [Spirochaetia bacterium]